MPTTPTPQSPPNTNITQWKYFYYLLIFLGFILLSIAFYLLYICGSSFNKLFSENIIFALLAYSFGKWTLIFGFIEEIKTKINSSFVFQFCIVGLIFIFLSIFRFEYNYLLGLADCFNADATNS